MARVTPVRVVGTCAHCLGEVLFTLEEGGSCACGKTRIPTLFLRLAGSLR